MALTLLEAAKAAFMEGKEYEAAIIRQYAESSDVLAALSFRNLSGGALSYNREETLPGIGFRGINGSFTESTGIINPQVETLAIAGGDLDVDNHITRTMGESIRSDQEMMKVKALSLSWTNTFINGDTEVDPKEFDGLKKRLTGTQLIAAGATSGGDALSLTKLDELIDAVVNPTGLVMNKNMRRRLKAAARATGVGGYVTTRPDEFGRQISMYDDLPIMILDEDNEANKILPFTEVGSGGGTAQTCSIYCVSMGELRLQGLQHESGIMVRNLGELQEKPSSRTRVEWDCGIAIFDGRAAARLYGITDAAVVA